jgi:hypothetical protein
LDIVGNPAFDVRIKSSHVDFIVISGIMTYLPQKIHISGTVMESIDVVLRTVTRAPMGEVYDHVKYKIRHVLSTVMSPSHNNYHITESCPSDKIPYDVIAIFDSLDWG